MLPFFGGQKQEEKLDHNKTLQIISPKPAVTHQTDKYLNVKQSLLFILLVHTCARRKPLKSLT